MADRLKVESLTTASGIPVYRLPLEVFAGYYGYAHLVMLDDAFVLVDTGSGFGNSHAHLLAGFEELEHIAGMPVSLSDLTHIVITHGHVDHYGGLRQIQDLAREAQVICHPLARPVLIKHDERVMVTKNAMEVFLRRAGVPDDHRDRLMNMYMIGKQSFPPMRVDQIVEDGDVILDQIRVIHVPGHAPGLIMIQLDGLLFTSDHILPGTSVALAPESIMPYTGVGHYIESLNKAIQLPEIQKATGGHDWVMDEYYEIASKTLNDTISKIDRVMDLAREPITIFEIATAIYGAMDGYGELLRLEQTGARVEYLNQRGLLMVENLDVLDQEQSPAIQYRRI